MKKIISLMLAMFMVIGLASAQTVEHGKFFHNTYVGINGGVTTPMIPAAGTSYFSILNPTFGLELGKNVNQVVGFSLEGQGFTTTSFNSIEKTNVVGNLKLNLSNWFAGYKGYPRRVEFLIVPGIGWAHDFSPTPKDPNYITYNTGAEINFNLGNNRAWQVNLKPSVVWNCINGQMGWYPKHADIRASAGLTYKFGYKNISGERTHNFTIVNTGVSEDDFNELYEKYNNLLNAPKEVDTVVIEKIVVDTVVIGAVQNSEVFVSFEKGSSELSINAIALIEQFVCGLPEGCGVKVIGSADSSTGSEKFNKELSLERANTVADTLKQFGVKDIDIENTIDINDTPENSRCALIIMVD